MRKIMTGERLVFAGGTPRSGLTLLRAILNGHSQIHCGPDSGILPGMALQWRDISSTLGELHYKYFELPPEDVHQNFARAIASILEKPLDQSGKRRIVEKTALNNLIFEDLAKLFPSAKFIHVVRDGRDVSASLLARDWRDPNSGALFPHVSDPAAAAAYWRGLTKIGLQAEKNINDPSRFYTLRYEELVTKPENTLTSLMAFIGEPYEPDTLNLQKRDLALVGLEAESETELSKPIHSDQIGRWRRDLSKPALEQVLYEAGATLRALDID